MIINLIIGVIVGTVLFQSAAGAIVGLVLGYLLFRVSEIGERQERIARDVGLLSAARRYAEPRHMTETCKAPVEPVAESLPPITPPERPTELMIADTMFSGKVYSKVLGPSDTRVGIEQENLVQNELEIQRASATPIRPAAVALDADTDGTWEAIVAFYQRWLGNKNPIVVTGVALLFLGIAFLFSYAVQQGFISISIGSRCLAVAALAAGMVFVGWRHRESNPNVAGALQGGGLATWYLTLFVSYRFFFLVDQIPAFFLLVVIAGLGVFLAYSQRALALAVLAEVGGFLAPIAVSEGHGSFLELFSFYLVLNIAVFFLACTRNWRVLNSIGFLFTFLVGLAWGNKYYIAHNFSSVEPFLILFFLFYLAIPIVNAIRFKTDPQDALEAPLVFGVPAIGILLQWSLVSGFEYGLAWSTLILAVVYLGLAECIRRVRPDVCAPLARMFGAIGLFFSAMMIPLALSQGWTGMVWAIYGAALNWAGLRNQSKFQRSLGVLVVLGASISFISSLGHAFTGDPFLNRIFWGSLVLSLAAFKTMLDSERAHGKLSVVAPFALLLGLLWWFFGWGRDCLEYFNHEYHLAVLVSLCSLSALALSAAGQIFSSKLFIQISSVQPAALLVYLVPTVFLAQNPLADGGLVSWFFAFCSAYWILFRSEQTAAVFPLIRHAIAFDVLVAVGALTVYWATVHITNSPSDWPLTLSSLTIALVVAGFSLAKTADFWPLGERLAMFIWAALFVPVLVLLLFFLCFMGFSGTTPPWSYVPVFNPVELTAIMTMVVIVLWLRRISAVDAKPEAFAYPASAQAIVPILGFALLNAAIARSVHYFFGIPFKLNFLLESSIFQSAVTVTWGMTALIMIWIAARRGYRTLWLGGAALIAIVVCKLFLVDLSQTGTISRIVSFVGIGVLMMLIGYFSPMPPDRKSDKKPDAVEF